MDNRAATLIERFTDLSRQFVDDGHTPGLAVAVAFSDAPPQAHTWGLRQIDPPCAITLTTRFHLGSLSKLTVAIAVWRLIERGALRLDSELVVRDVRFMLPRGSSSVRVQDVLLHLSGISDTNTWREEVDDTPPPRIDLPDIVRIKKAPGTGWCYSNLAFGLLARMVADTVGTSFEEHIKSTVFSPLGLTSAYFTRDAGTDPELALPYDRVDETWRVSPIPVVDPLPSIGLVCDPLDAVRLAAATAYSRRLLRLSMFEHLGQARYRIDGSGTHQRPYLLRSEMGGNEIFWHDGLAGGHSTMLYFIPRLDCTFALFTNVSTWGLKNHLGPVLVRRALGLDQPTSTTPRPIAKSPLVGRYGFPVRSILEPRPP
ncbi:serine hydrolase, partial [Pseudonocardia sp. ICBG162]